MANNIGIKREYKIPANFIYFLVFDVEMPIVWKLLWKPCSVWKKIAIMAKK